MSAPAAVPTPARLRLLGDESGMAMIAALLVMVLVSGLASAALLYSQMDVAVAGNYRLQRRAEAVADGGLELAKAMIYGKSPQLSLPLSIPAAGWDTYAKSFTYADADLSLAVSIAYKFEDGINYYNKSPHPADKVVRYGQDYNYQQAEKAVGKQPVWKIAFNDAKTGTKGEADLVTALAFTTPSALYCGGKVHMQKYQWATEESIEVTAGQGTPAIATASGLASDITVETVRESTPIPAASATSGSYNMINSSGTSTTYAINALYLHPRVYRPSEVEASKVAGQYNEAREKAHILLGIGERFADLDAVYTAAGGGSAGRAAANAVFRFYNRTADGLAGGYDVPVAFNNATNPPTCSGIVCYGYQLPAAQPPLTQLETLLGQSFADLKSLADQEFTCTTTVALPTGGNSNNGCNLSGVSLGTAAKPQVVYFNGTGSATPIALVTNAGTQVSGYGVLVINGNADIVGSINWTGLMVINGSLIFRPWQGGTAGSRSGPELATRWNGFLIVGTDLDLWTYWGGSIILGYDTSELNNIKVIISNAVPHKVLSWRRSYN